MTTIEKSELIQYINYLTVRGEEARRKSRQSTVQYTQGWLGGTAESRKQIASDLTAYIEKFG